MELVSSQPFDDFPVRDNLTAQGVEDKFGYITYFQEGLR